MKDWPLLLPVSGIRILCTKRILLSSCLLLTENEKPCQEPATVDGVYTLDPGFLCCVPGGARFSRVKVPNPPGSGKDIAEGKGAYREVDLKEAGCGEPTNPRANLWSDGQKPYRRLASNFLFCFNAPFMIIIIKALNCSLKTSLKEDVFILSVVLYFFK